MKKALLLLPLAGVLVGATSEVHQGFDIKVPVAPIAVPVGGVPTLRFELHLTNFAAKSLVVKRMEFARSTIEGAAIGPAATEGVAPGMRAIVYVDIPLADVGSRPPVLVYDADGEELHVFVRAFAIQHAQPPALGAPLRGGPWAAVYTVNAERGHRRVIYAVAGAAHLPGRFAVDWFRIDAKGRHAAAGDARRDDWYGEGADVLAVADGTISAMRDGVPEHARTDVPVKVPIGDATGNYVALNIGGGRFAFYEHLKPGLPVKLGQRVRRGQVIARLGMTGQTTGPHLHFHLADAPSPLDAEGMPYVLSNAVPVGGFSSISAFGRGEQWQPLPGQKGGFFPAPNQVVAFPK